MSQLLQKLNSSPNIALLAIIPACVVSFFLFYLMQYLISGNTTLIAKSSDISTLDFVRIQRDEQSEEFKRRLPKKTKTMTPPPVPQDSAATDENTRPVIPEFKMKLPDLSGLNLGTGPFLGGMSELKSDSEVIPLVRVEPRYPRKALRAGTQGWVKVQFTILENGTVTNAKVIEAKPRRIFNREAIRAIQRWKFKPKIVDGKAMQQTATQTINFKLDK